MIKKGESAYKFYDESELKSNILYSVSSKPEKNIECRSSNFNNID